MIRATLTQATAPRQNQRNRTVFKNADIRKAAGFMNIKEMAQKAEVTLRVMRRARDNDPDFPPVAKTGPNGRYASVVYDIDAALAYIAVTDFDWV